MAAAQLPVEADLLYLPGGYPELYLAELAGNQSLLEHLRAYAAAGGRIMAECGGMMYLGRSIADEAGDPHTMAGILPIATSMERKKLSIGYRTIMLPQGSMKGHEFHYSQFTSREGLDAGKVYNARGEQVEAPFFYTPGLLASYMHLYWGEDPGFLENWLHGIV